MKCNCKICGSEFLVEPKKHEASGKIVSIEFNGCQCGTVISLASTDLVSAVSSFHRLTGNMPVIDWMNEFEVVKDEIYHLDPVAVRALNNIKEEFLRLSGYTTSDF